MNAFNIVALGIRTLELIHDDDFRDLIEQAEAALAEVEGNRE